MIYCLYGEDYKKIDEFINQIIKDNNIEDKVVYDTSEVQIEEILTECNYISMFGDKKIIIANGCEFLTGRETLESEELNKYIENPNENSILVFKVLDSKLDERKKLVKLIKEKTTVKVFNLPDEKNMSSYIKDYYKSAGFKIDNESINEIVNRININKEVLNTELEKLSLYKEEEKTININDVRNIVCEYDKDDLIFELSNAVVTKNKEKIFKIYSKLKKNNNEPIALIALIANQLRLMLNVKILLKERMNQNEIATTLKKHPYRIQLAINECNKLSEKEIWNLLNLLFELDLKIKKGQIDKYEGLETFLLNLYI